MENHIEGENVPKPKDWTTIELLKTTRAKLDTLKLTSRETKEEIVNRLMDSQV